MWTSATSRSPSTGQSSPILSTRTGSPSRSRSRTRVRHSTSSGHARTTTCSPPSRSSRSLVRESRRSATMTAYHSFGSAIAGRGQRRDAVLDGLGNGRAAGLDLESGRDDDADVAAVAEGPRIERREGRSDADVAGGPRRTAGQVVVDAETGRLLVLEVAPEVDLDDRVAVRGGDLGRQRSLARRSPDFGGLGVDGDHGRVVEVARRQRAARGLLDQVGLVVRGRNVDGDVDEALLRDEPVGRGRCERELVVRGEHG